MKSRVTHLAGAVATAGLKLLWKQEYVTKSSNLQNTWSNLLLLLDNTQADTARFQYPILRKRMTEDSIMGEQEDQ